MHVFNIYLPTALCFIFFFFSSRRRHTRCLSDWSSDVCSSDLRSTLFPWHRRRRSLRPPFTVDASSRVVVVGWPGSRKKAVVAIGAVDARVGVTPSQHRKETTSEIGRASCRERG